MRDKIMKNILRYTLFFLLSVILFGKVNAQSLELLNPETAVNGTTTDDLIKSHAKIKNKSTSPKNLLVKLQTTLAPGHSFSFCDPNSCFSGTDAEFTTSDPFTLGPGEDTGDLFYMGLVQVDWQNPKEGISTIIITVFVAGQPLDNVEYTVVFTVTKGVGVDDYLTSSFNYLSIPTPSPAVDYVRFDCKSTDRATIAVYDILGNKVFQNAITQERNFIEIITSELSNGSYNALLFQNGKQVGKQKFIVSH
jgi:hypothetical protein